MNAVCVFCGSNFGNKPVYEAAAVATGAAIAKRGLRLVYGGAKVGLMGVVADAALAAGGEVVGVIPEALIEREIAHEGLTELRTVGSMHARKQEMADLSDAFMALPGGAGTMEEAFEVWTWGQLGHHEKPVGFLNVERFFSKLVAFLDHQSDEGFMRRAHREMLMVHSEPDALLDRFESYKPPTVEKWIPKRSQT